MKKIINIFSVIFLLAFLVLSSACTPTTGGGTDIDNPPVDGTKIVITPKVEVIKIKDFEVEKMDYTSYFTITEDDIEVEVKKSYIDSTKVSLKPGEYNVTCKYKGSSAKIKVVVSTPIYRLDLQKDEIELNVNSVLDYDFKKLFSAYIDDELVEITDEMIETNVTNSIGSYTYTVNFNNIIKTIKVLVTDKYVLEIIKTYKDLKLSVNDLQTFDFTTLFSLYVEEENVKVTNDMIDKSELANPVVGNIYKVNFTYTKGSSTLTSSTNIEIIENKEIKITGKNEVIPPNGANVDLTELFIIKEGDEIVPVTMEMISGTIDYSKVGNNVITVNYKGVSASANVEVKLGVIVDYAKTDTVVIAKGTKQSDYSFMSDFKVFINGIKFNNISEEYLDSSSVDFSKAGTYTATLKLPYNDNKLGLSGVKFTYVEKTITYVVVENNYKIEVVNSIVELSEGTTSYDQYRNLKVIINGRNQTLTEILDYVDIITCYVQTISDPIDFSYNGMQEVKIAVYANGVNEDPEIVSFNVIIKSNLVINHTDKVIFVGESVNPTTLFNISYNNQNIDVTYDMLSGRVDQFTPGTYTVNLEYKGIIESARVIVFDNNLKGTYKTDLYNIGDVYTSSGDDEETAPKTKVGNLVIGEDGSIVFNGRNAKIVNAIDEKTMIIKYSSYEYTLYYDNGIIFLDPDNSSSLTFYDDKRPYVYFNTSMWEIEDKVIVNQYSKHVLETTIITYSIDCFKVKNLLNNESYWYGLKIDLIDKTSSDTVYTVTFDEVSFKDGFIPSAGTVSYVVFDKVKYDFKMEDSEVGKVSGNTGVSYANKVFKGIISGKEAEIRTDQYEGFTLFIDNEFIFKLGIYELGNLVNGGINKDTNIGLFYDFDEGIYSYKFKFNLEDNTFIYYEKDNNFGYYLYDNMYIFLDGYGTGLINFDTKSYYKTQFTYTQNVNIITAKYFNIKPSFKYGTGFEAYISPLLNVLTIKDINSSVNVIGAEFKNKEVLTGAIVNIKSYQVGQDSDAVAKAELYKNIEIITKDGILDNNDMAKMIDTSRIRFSTPGFYQFSVTVNVNGENIIQYYAIEVLKSIYENNAVVSTYGAGEIYDTNSLSIDKYGRVILNANGIVYNGSIKIYEDNSFVINATNDKNISVTGTGKLITNGLISVRFTGGITFSDYFTTGSSNVYGTESFALREFIIGNNKVYLASNVASQIGEVASVNVIDGNIIKITVSGKEYIAKLVKANDTKKGLELSDKYRGTYTNGSSNITFDGFGKVTTDNEVGTYTLNGSYATITFESGVKLYKLDNVNYTYSEVDIKLDNSLVIGKSFSATYYFSCDSYLYNATTTFTFLENGVVSITSTSVEHDTGTDACTTDLYSPTFTSNNASYNVSGNIIKISSNGVSFEFKIVNLLSVDSIICQNTSLSSDAHGYFNIGATYIIVIA